MNITINEVKLKPIDDKFYEVLEDIHYINGLVVPKGFITDSASIPVEFQDIIGKPDDLRYRDASILHDFLYSKYNTYGISRLEADTMAFELSLQTGCDENTALLMFSGVRVGGQKYFVIPKIDGSTPSNE